MNKTDLARKISTEKEITIKAATAEVEDVFGAIADVLATGDEVSISGFGKFSVVDVAERTGTIQMGDRKGETYTTPAHRAPKFKAASALKDAVR